MIDCAEMARRAIEVVWPIVAAGGVTMAVGGARKAGADVFDWLKRKLVTPAGVEALNEAEQAPSSDTNREILTLRVQKLLEQDESARKELEQLLPAGVWQSDVIVGDGNISVKVAGSGSSVHIGGTSVQKDR
jgi:hypothetical protein